jgi:glucosyl-dolichyl phosphate glucuronosyltransferase
VNENMTITVVIATYNRAALLAECLEHLARQRFEPGDQVVVADNGSSDATPQVLASARSRFSVPFAHVSESKPGKSRALARAREVATGDVLAFTDDDVDVDESWLDAIRQAMADPTVALVGGPVRARWQQTAPRWLRVGVQHYGRLNAPLALLDYGAGATDLGPRTVIGANMAVRRDVFERMGGFAPHLGKLRGTLMSGEDHDLCRRVQAAGLRAVYCPEAGVRHFVPAERMRAGYYLSWFFWSGITHAALDRDQPVPGRTIGGVPLYLVRRIATSGLGALPKAIVGDLAGAMDRLTEVAFAAGYASRSWPLSLPRLPGTPVERQS